MIEVRDLRKSFGTALVLKGVTFRVQPGESVVIIGRSGGGKSVLLKHLIGLLHPDSGEVFIEGARIDSMNERELLAVRRRFGMLFQGAALFDSMNVAENIGFALRRQRSLSEREISIRVSEALEMVELGAIQNKMPSQLSGGMRKRVGLARAIIYQPQIILYDEPTTGLDPVVSDSIDKLILRVSQRLHCTTVTVTHDMRTAKRIGDRILMLHEGHILMDGPPDDVFSASDPVVHRFVNGVSDATEATFLE